MEKTACGRCFEWRLLFFSFVHSVVSGQPGPGCISSGRRGGGFPQTDSGKTRGWGQEESTARPAGHGGVGGPGGRSVRAGAGARAAARGWAIVLLRLRLFICEVGFILFTHWSRFFLIQVSSSQRHIGLPAPGRPARPPCPLRAASELWPRGFSALRAVPDQALPVPSWLLVRINRVHPTGSLNFQFQKEELESSLFSEDVSNNSGRTQVCVYHLWPLSG